MGNRVEVRRRSGADGGKASGEGGVGNVRRIGRWEGRARWLAGGGLASFLGSLSDAFGWRYVAVVVIEAGINQAMGMRFMMSARSYYLLDEVGIDASQLGQLTGFTMVPWQLKSLFGLLSDTVAINGLHRSPYIFIAGTVGVASALFLVGLPASAMTPALAALLFLLFNFNVAVADVMIDATICERTQERPDMAARLQALVLGSSGLLAAPAAIISGYLLANVGTQSLFGLGAACAVSVSIPALFGWVSEKRKPGPRGCKGNCDAARVQYRSITGSRTKRSVARAACLVGVYSIFLGTVQLVLGQREELTVFLAIAMPLLNFALCGGVYCILRDVDTCLARALVYSFLANALCPFAPIMFEWSHDVAGGVDDRCASAEACVAKAAQLVLNATSIGDSFAHTALLGDLGAPDLSPDLSDTYGGGAGSVFSSESFGGSFFARRLGESPGGGWSARESLPCGWARERNYPCLSPIIFSWADVAGAAAMVLGTTLYTTVFQKWSYRRVLMLTEGLLALISLMDLVWVLRLNLRIGIPDEALVFGDEVVSDVITRLNIMPFLIFAAKLCPPDVEGSMFALFMGLSNFGRAAGGYLGSSLLILLGGVDKPDYDQLPLFITVRACMRALPLLLIPFLVPKGSPNDPVEAMGTGAAFAAVLSSPKAARKAELALRARDEPSVLEGAAGGEGAPEEGQQGEGALLRDATLGVVDPSRALDPALAASALDGGAVGAGHFSR